MAKRQKQPPNFVDLRKVSKKPASSFIQDVLPSRSPHKKRFDWSLARLPRPQLIATTAGALIIFVMLLVSLGSSPPNPVPKNINSAVNFPVYYPAADKLPAGYTLDTKSFRTSQNTVLYTINEPSGKLIVTVQARPSNANIQRFYRSLFTKHQDETTPLGTARLGTVGSQTIASLPAAKALILVGAPKNIDYNQLTATLRSLRQP